MSDNKLSTSSYTVSNVSSTSTETKVIKRPYANIPFSSGKRQNKSNSFKDTLNSVVSNKPSNDDCEDFSDLLSNELNNSQRLTNSENSRFIKATFENNILNNNNLDKLDNNSSSKEQPHITSEVEANISEIRKKIELLNSIRKK